jgi:hypothetical protein
MATATFMTAYVVWGLSCLTTPDRCEGRRFAGGVDYLRKEIVKRAELRHQAWMLHALAVNHARRATARLGVRGESSQ